MSEITTNTYLGYIEGYYGNLLNWRDRFRLIKTLKNNGMNSYFYAAKDDPKHRYNWRKQYSKNWLQKFNNFCSHAAENNIEVIIGISPGRDFDFNEIYTKKCKNPYTKCPTKFCRSFRANSMLLRSCLLDSFTFVCTMCL